VRTGLWPPSPYIEIILEQCRLGLTIIHLLNYQYQDVQFEQGSCCHCWDVEISVAEPTHLDAAPRALGKKKVPIATHAFDIPSQPSRNKKN
jgi:hypothetical protein